MSKKKRKGRAIDHCWKFVKYKGDVGFYAKCNCGYHYGCSTRKYKDAALPMIPAPGKLYNYCPHCGARKTRYCDEPIAYIDKYWFE